MSINENVMAIRQVIADAAKKSGRNSADIKLIGVTKTIDANRVKELLAAGVTDFGESRVQEFLPKREILKNETTYPHQWHFIGHLQRNKVKHVVDNVDTIHSVDSLPLAQEINRCCEKLGRQIKILAEINIAGESSKFGIPPSEILEFVKNLVNMRGVRLSGLMCLPPFVENPDENRVFFEKMQKISVDILSKCIYDTDKLDLSMGTSGDFSVAIEHGATMVRIGTAIFEA